MGDTYIFVYGSLMSGFGLHHLISHCHFFGTINTTNEYTLVNLGYYPGLLFTGNYKVYGEVYKVNQETLSLLDKIEFGAGYTRQKILLEQQFDQDVYGYIYKYGGQDIIKSGNWNLK